MFSDDSDGDRYYEDNFRWLREQEEAEMTEMFKSRPPVEVSNAVAMLLQVQNLPSKDAPLQKLVTRFLYTNNAHCTFIAGNPDKYCGQNFKAIIDLATEYPTKFISVLADAHEDVLLPRKKTLLQAVVYALTDRNVPIRNKQKIKSIVLPICQTDEEFFYFVKSYFSSNKQKMSKTLRKLIQKFYEDKEPLEFAKCLKHGVKYHGWSHKDLIKLCHINFLIYDKCIVIDYILFGVDKLVDNKDEGCQAIIDYLRKLAEYRTTSDAIRVVALIKELHVNKLENTSLHKCDEAWAAIIPELTTSEVLHSLTKFYKFGLLKSGTHTHTAVIEALTDVEGIKKSRLHPLQVFICMKNFEKGGKALDPKYLDYLQRKDLKPEVYKKLTTPNEPKCPVIFNNINKCLMLSYNNFPGLGKKFMITLDYSTENPMCMHNRNISALEAAYSLIRYLYKNEKNIIVAVYQNEHIHVIDLHKSGAQSFGKFSQLVKEVKSAHCWPSAPFDWAVNKKKSIDVFVNFLNCNYLLQIPKSKHAKVEKPDESLSKYCETMKTPNTRLVRIFPGGVPTLLPDDTHNILTISGFDEEVPIVFEAFCSEKFS